MKVLILSDLHLEFAPFEPVPDLEFDVVILTGEIHSPAKRAIQWPADRFHGNPRGYLNRSLRRSGKFEKNLDLGHVVDV